MHDDDEPRAASSNALARRAGLGDRAAFDELYARHVQSTHRFALRMLDSDPGLAEEVLQESWIKAWRRLPDFQGRASFTTWMFTIVSRQAADVRRRRRPMAVDHQLLEPAAGAGGPDAAGDPHREYLKRELWETLAIALAELPWRQRAAWLLRELEGLSYADIAAVLDTTAGVVRGQLHRGRRTLAIRMEQWR